MFNRLLHSFTGYATSLHVALLGASKATYKRGLNQLVDEFSLDNVWITLDKKNEGYQFTVSLYCHNPRKIDFYSNRVVIYKKSKMASYDIAFGEITKQVYDCAQDFRDSIFTLWWQTDRTFDFDKIEWIEASAKDL